MPPDSEKWWLLQRQLECTPSYETSLPATPLRPQTLPVSTRNGARLSPGKVSVYRPPWSVRLGDALPKISQFSWYARLLILQRSCHSCRGGHQASERRQQRLTGTDNREVARGLRLSLEAPLAWPFRALWALDHGKAVRRRCACERPRNPSPRIRVSWSRGSCWEWLGGSPRATAGSELRAERGRFTPAIQTSSFWDAVASASRSEPTAVGALSNK